MQWLNPGKQGYKYLNTKFSSLKEYEKADADFSRDKLVEVLGWVNSNTTQYLKNALTQEKEAIARKVLSCDEKELRYLQGKADAIHSVIRRIESLGDTARKIL